MKSINFEQPDKTFGRNALTHDKCVQSFFYKVVSCRAEVGHWIWVIEF